MIRGITQWSLHYRFLVIVLAAALMVFGITQLRSMPVDVLPEFSPPYVEIQTEALGLSAEEVEQLITVPMEQDLLSGVAWLDTIRSKSVPGMSSVVVFFEPGTDLMQARQMVSERLTQAVALPHVSKPPVMLQPLSSSSRFIIVGLSSQQISPIQMSVLARWTVGPRLMGVPGVSNVAIWGQRDRQLQVQVVPERLRAHDVTLQQVLETTGNALWVSSLSFLEASTPGTGGFIDTPQQRLGIWHVSPISSATELAQVSVEGTQLRLGDVARVVEDHQPLIGDAIANDTPSLLLVIEKLPGANTLNVTQGVENALEAMKPGLSGIDINTNLFRPASYIETAMGNLGRTLLIGAVLAALILVLFLFSWRVALVSIVAIPLSLLASLIVLHLRGATLNAIVLAGLMIALGVIVDDAVIDAENTARRLRQFRREGRTQSTLSIVLQSSHEMRSAMLFATLLLLLTIVPVFFIEGVSGSFFQPLAVSYALAVLVSMFVALVITPALSMVLLSDVPNAPHDRGEPPLARWLKQTYDRILAPVVRSPRLAYGAIAVMLVAGLVTVPLLIQQSKSQSLLPRFKEPDVLISLDGAPGASHPAMVRIANQASRELRAIPGVRNVGAHVGRAVFGDQVVGMNSAQIWVNIDPSADYDTTVANIQEAADGYPGIQRNVHTYLEEKSSAIVTGSNGPMTVRVFGENLDTLKGQAEVVQKAISGVSGISDPQVNLPIEEPTLEIEVDLNKAERYGIKPVDVRRTAATMLSGLQVGMLFEDQKVFDVVVWSTPATRQSLTSIRDLLIDTPSGGRVRLQDVADVRIASSPNVIHRESISPYIDVTFAAQGRDPAAIASDMNDALRGIQFPLEYHAEVLGAYAEQQAAQQRMLLVMAITVIGIFLLLQAAFGSWRMALAGFLCALLALVGGLVAALTTGSGFASLGVLAGLLLIFGIAIRNCITLISHYQHLRMHEGEPFGLGIVLRGSRERAVPILMTALVTAVIFVPFILFGNIAGQEIEHPMAVVVLGGLVTSTVLNLFIVPALYLRFGQVTESVEEFTSPAIPVVPAK